MPIYDNTELTPKEHLLMENDNEQGRLIREYNITIKQLELEVQREKNMAAIELKRLEAKWSSLLRLPSQIIKLPVFLLLGLGYIVSVIRKTDVSKDFWNYLK
jgi:hypothetical protein